MPNGQDLLVTQASLPFNEHFALSRVGLLINADPSFEDCQALGPKLCSIEDCIQFARGDFVNYVEDKFGERASQIIDPDTGWTESTVKVYSWVARSVPIERRMPGLSFKHHQLVAALDAEGQRMWLKRATGAEDGGEPWSAGRLARALRGGDDPAVTEVWLLTLCKDQADLEKLKTELESKGRTCKPIERRARQKTNFTSTKRTRKKPEITARAKRPGKRRARKR